MTTWISPLSTAEEQEMHPDALAILKYYQLDRLPVESTFYKNTYRTLQESADGTPVATAMIGMYCEKPLSVSCFHRLEHDEIWHAYGGDPFKLVLLYPDGTSKEIIMGTNPLNGEAVQFVVPAHVWQAGSVLPGGRYALFGCTMAPGYTGKDFEAAIAEDLIKLYPDHVDEIRRLSVNAHETRMPDGFTQ